MRNPNVVVIPLPLQGHVSPLMNLSHKLAQHGFKITFVNTDFNQKRVRMNSRSGESLVGWQSQIRLVSIPDGLGPEDDRSHFGKLLSSMWSRSTMPAMLEKLIQDLSSHSEMISCVVADVAMGWALQVARKLGIKGAAFWPASAATSALQISVPKLIHDGTIDSNGFPIEKRTFQLYPSMPIMETNYIFWTNGGDPKARKIMLNHFKRSQDILDLTEWWFCNTTNEIEPGALSYIPKLQPIGPIVGSDHVERPIGHFWEEDLSCLSWLDQHPPCSVVYLAFGSSVVLYSKQLEEIALGLELTNRPFLWVVRPEMISSAKKVNPQHELKGSLGKIVGWAPQWKVLGQPPIACFISHCGWNSVIEGWTGLGFDFHENGFVSSEEIMKKVEQLLGDKDIRARSLKLKKVVTDNIAQSGQSAETVNKFVTWLKDKSSLSI